MTLNGLNDINIFIGRNNTGKSTVLEAVSLLASGGAAFKNSFGEDMLDFITFRRGRSKLAWDYLIRSGSKRAVIIGHKQIDKADLVTEGVSIAHDVSSLDIDPDAKLTSDLNRLVSNRMDRYYAESAYNLGRIPSPVPRNYRKLIFYYRNDSEVLAQLSGTDDIHGDPTIVRKKSRAGHLPRRTSYLSMISKVSEASCTILLLKRVIFLKSLKDYTRKFPT